MRKTIGVAVLASMIAGCGGGGGSTTPTSVPTATPAPTAAKAVVTLGASNNTYTVSSSEKVLDLVLQCGAFHADWVLTESAGLGAHATQTDFYLVHLNGDIADRVVNTSPALPIPASGQVKFSTDRTDCGYIGRDFPATMKGTVNITDDKGNTLTLNVQIPFVEK